MKYERLLYIIVPFILNSCMTITTYKNYDATFYTDVSNMSVQIKNDTVSTPLPAKISLERSNKKLNVKVLQNDSVVNNTQINPKLSTGVIVGNLYSWNIPGMIIDITTGRGYSYGQYFIVDSFGKITSLKRPTEDMSKNLHIATIKPHEKGDFNIQLSIPGINLFHLSPKNETTRNLGGFFGLGIGAEYFYKKNKSLQLRGDMIIDYPVPVPMGIDWDESEPRESCDAYNINLTDNFYIKRFQLGYGLNYAKNTWFYSGYYKNLPEIIIDENYKQEWIEGKTKTNMMLGLALNSYYRFTSHFYMGVIYRPSFFELSNPKFKYEHSISFDFLWKIHL